jgi:5-methylcytosine-specific restriction protein A
MSRRRHLTKLMRTRIFDSTKGVCCICDTKIDAERGAKWIVEHCKPLWMGGADDETNMKPAHQACAIEKTVGEAPVKAKNDRIRARYLGIRKPSRMPGSKDSRFKKKIDGSVVLR